MLLLPRAYPSQKLSQPLPIKDGRVLRAIGAASNYMPASLTIAPSFANAGSMPPSSSSTTPKLLRSADTSISPCSTMPISTRGLWMQSALSLSELAIPGIKQGLQLAGPSLLLPRLASSPTLSG
jgi:hypothetical protein